MEIQKVFASIATAAGILPIIYGGVVYKRLSSDYKLLFYFFIYAFLTDFLVGILYNFNISLELSKILFMLYPLIESVFQFWFFGRQISDPSIKRVANIFLIAMLPYYLITVFLAGTMLDKFYFNTTYNILISFISGFVLLKAAEKFEEMFKEPIVWIALGVLTYSLGTFFLYSIFDTEIRKHIWYIHNIVSILTNLLIARGFYTIGKSQTFLPSRV